MRSPVVVQAAHVADDGREYCRKSRLIARRVKQGAVGEAIAVDLDVQQRRGHRGRSVRGDEARGRSPAGTQAGGIQRCQGAPDEGRIRREVGGVRGGRDRLARGEQASEQIRVADFQPEAQVDDGRRARGTEVGCLADRLGQRGRRLGNFPAGLLGGSRLGALASEQRQGQKTQHGDEPELHGKVASQTSASDTTSKPSFR